MVFHGSRLVLMVFHGLRLFFHGSGWVSWFFMVPDWFFMVSSRFLWFVMVPGGFFMVPGWLLMVFCGSRSVKSIVIRSSLKKSYCVRC